MIFLSFLYVPQIAPTDLSIGGPSTRELLVWDLFYRWRSSARGATSNHMITHHFPLARPIRASLQQFFYQEFGSNKLAYQVGRRKHPLIAKGKPEKERTMTKAKALNASTSRAASHLDGMVHPTSNLKSMMHHQWWWWISNNSSL